MSGANIKVNINKHDEDLDVEVFQTSDIVDNCHSEDRNSNSSSIVGEELPVSNQEILNGNGKPSANGITESSIELTDVENNINNLVDVKGTDIVLENTIQQVNELDISKNAKPIHEIKTEVIINKETDALKHLLIYEEDSSDNDDFEKNWQLHTIPSSSSDSQSESNDSVNESDQDIDDCIADATVTRNNGAVKKPPKKTGFTIEDLDIDDTPLPDLCNLKIDYETEEFLHIGHIQAIIEMLVTVEAIPGTPAYDLDTILFVEVDNKKKPLGSIYDVIGPVVSPIYCIRFISCANLKDASIEKGQKVYSAPKSQYTNYVFVKELMKIKGSDASWVGDKELPPELAEISDDEDEHNVEIVTKPLKRKHGSLERHLKFEKSMNKCNTLNTRVAQLVDTHRRLKKSDNRQTAHNSRRNCMTDNVSRLPLPFDPTIPPPGFQNYQEAVWYPPQEDFRMDNVQQMWSWGPLQTQTMSAYAQTNSTNYRTNHHGGRQQSAGPSTRPY